MAFTRDEIETVAVKVFASVTDVNDVPSQQRMRAITNVYASMLANDLSTIDERTLHDDVSAMIGWYLKPDGTVLGPFRP